MVRSECHPAIRPATEAAGCEQVIAHIVHHHPVEALRPLPVTGATGQPVDATAVAIDFADGTQGVYFHAPPGAGQCRFGDLPSDARCAYYAVTDRMAGPAVRETPGLSFEYKGSPAKQGH